MISAADWGDKVSVPEVGTASGCSGVATTSGPWCGRLTFTEIVLSDFMFTTTTARFPSLLRTLTHVHRKKDHLMEGGASA